MDVETQLQGIFKDILKTDIIVEVFSGYVDLSPKGYELSMQGCMDQFRTYFNTQPTDKQASVVEALIRFVHKEKNDRRVAFLFDFIESCIKDGFLPAKLVLGKLQPSDLTYTKKVHWIRTYRTIQKFVYLVDYKACSNVLGNVMSKMREIPAPMWNLAKQQVNVICKTIEHLLDPEACLLPGYLAVNEIRQKMPEEKIIAPWPLLDKLNAFVDRFRATSSMVSVTGRWMLLPIVHNTFHQLASIWRLDQETLRFPLKRQLPYTKEMYQRQHRLLRYILSQGHSRDAALEMLGLQKTHKQRCGSLDEELVELMLAAMASNHEDNTEDDASLDANHLIWLHLSSQVICFVRYQFANVSHMVQLLYGKLSASVKDDLDIREGRDHLMWVLLQVVTESLQKLPPNGASNVLSLINLLYPENQPLPLSDATKPKSVAAYAAACIVVHFNHNSQADTGSGGSEEKQHGVPVSLQNHYQYLKQCMQAPTFNLQDFRIAYMCNAAHHATDVFEKSLKHLVESVFGDVSSTFNMPGTNCKAIDKVTPLSMDLIDSLTAQAKIRIVQKIVQKIVQPKLPVALSPALLETYSRFLVYNEIESVGMKVFVTQILPKVAADYNWQVLYGLLELVSYRIHHIQAVSRTQMLATLHQLSASSHMKSRQLHYRIESTALRLIMGFDNLDINQQLVCLLSDQKHLVSKNSEELNRVLVLTLARSLYITGAETISQPWCTETLKAIMAATPHTWPQKTLAYFPRIMQEFFQQNPVENTSKKTVRSKVEEQYGKWDTVLTTPTSNLDLKLNEVIEHFSAPGNPYLICLMWKALLERKSLSVTAYRILDGIGPAISAHERTFSDFLITEVSQGDEGDHQKVKVCADLLRDMVWKYNILSFDRLILCLALRSSDAKEIKVAFFIIQYLLFKPDDFRNRVHHCVQEVDNVDHWTQDDWHSKHMSYHQKFNENHYFEGLVNHCAGADGSGEPPSVPQPQYLPTYFSNVTLRFLPVLDIVIHRCLELPSNKSLEILLHHLGDLYRFHDKPIAFLFNTLKYYESRLRDSPSLKKKLVATITGAITEKKPANWALSQEYLDFYLHSDDTQWQPSSEYYCNLVKRLVDTIEARKPSPFASRDWRFSEFPNACAHALQVTCVEAMALPVASDVVGQSLIDVVLKSQSNVSRDESFAWMNAVALILTSLSESFWKPLHKNIRQMLHCDTLTSKIEGTNYPYHILTYSNQQQSLSDFACTRLLALSHIVWHHMNIGQLSIVSQFLKDELRPIVETELQLLYVFHLIGPYISRFHQERTRCMKDAGLALYDILLRVTKHGTKIVFIDEIADFLYHVKYMYIGISMNDKVEEVRVQLQPDLRERLRFITHATSSGRSQPAITSSTTGST